MTVISHAASHFESFVSSMVHQPGLLYIGLGLAVFMCYMVGFNRMSREYSKRWPRNELRRQE